MKIKRTAADPADTVVSNWNGPSLQFSNMNPQESLPDGKYISISDTKDVPNNPKLERI